MVVRSQLFKWDPIIETDSWLDLELLVLLRFIVDRKDRRGEGKLSEISSKIPFFLCGDDLTYFTAIVVMLLLLFDLDFILPVLAVFIYLKAFYFWFFDVYVKLIIDDFSLWLLNVLFVA